MIIPEGIWLTGPIELLSNVNLYTEQNALVLFTGDFEAYPIIATSFEGLETRRCQSPISARNAENIAITGYGTFDGDSHGNGTHIQIFLLNHFVCLINFKNIDHVNSHFR